MPLTIVMYHYVRDLAKSRYPEIKGLTVETFRSQLEYLASNYTVVGMDQVVQAAQGREELPGNAALLTFDDGYIDHFVTVFPILREMKMRAAFFPVPLAIREGRVLDVNKIHFVLNAVKDKVALAEDVRRHISDLKVDYDLESPALYWDEYARASRFDPPEIVFVKRVLQKGLPQAARARIADELFKEYVSSDEAEFASELYMSMDQLREMHDCGMHIGSHSYSHPWLDTLSPEAQSEEIQESLQFLRELGQDGRNWTMCYPYGAHNDGLIERLSQTGCAVGLTTRSAAADMGRDHPLRLPRFDATEIPRAAAA